MKTWSIILMAMALLLSAGASYAAMSVETYTVTPSTLKPGEEGSVTFSVKNVLPSTATTTIAPLEDVQVFYTAPTGIEFKAASPFTIGTIDSGGSALVSVPFRVLPTAKSGVITASFFISQKDKNDLKTVNAIIRVVNPPIITLSSDRQTILSTDVINLTITNNGGAASKFVIKLADGTNFSFMGTTQIYVGDLAKTTVVQVPLDSRKVTEGLNTIPFVISYQQEGGDTANETKYLTVAVKKEKADISFTQGEPIVTNKDNILKMKIRNRGRALDDFRVLLTDEKVKARESSQITLGNLATGQEKEFEVPVFADEQPGVRSTSFNVKWVEDDVEKEEAFSVPIVISSDAEVGIYLEVKPAPLAVGGDYTLSVTTSNLGSYKIANVVVAIEDSPSFDILNIQKEQYIGNLDNDAFSTVQYKIRVKSTIAAGDYPLAFKVRYKDQSGIWIEKEVKTIVSIRPASEGVQKDNGNGTLMLVGIVVLAGAAYWYFKMRKTGKSSLAGERAK
ncbi:TPA: hypothetical protein HA225_01665 [Candidatus Micrarchaeota archaeon]|nr:hypothetical protein [Candidatus Micrarchaeota archaeon]HIH29797.1 hypothetical protein [Candidatus Micrarchaeota archaeon]